MPGCRTPLGLARPAAVLVAALALAAGVTACGSSGSATPNTSGAPPFIVPTGTIAAPGTTGQTTSTKTTSSTTTTDPAASTPASTAADDSTPATTPQTTPQSESTPATTPNTTGGAGAAPTSATNPTQTSSNGGAGLGGSFCKENPGAC
jgi:hypothetical protein